MEITLCNMVMIEDEDTGRVLVQHRLPKATNPWCGLTFPGGHVEAGESVTASAVREIREETGLEVANLRMCGIVEWETIGKRTDDSPAEVTDNSKYIVFMFRASSWQGELKSSAEGKMEWMTLDEMQAGQMAPHMEEYLRVLLEEDAVEAFGFSGKELEVLHGEQSARSKASQFANMLKDRVGEFDYSFRSVLYGTQRMTIEVLDIIHGRNRDEYPLILNKTPDFKLHQEDNF